MSSDPDFGLHADFYTFAPHTLAEELPEFEIRGEVGKGSMGIVYEAVRRHDGQRVALKVLPPSLTLTERALARFLREAELIGKVRHPAIVGIHEHGRQGRLHYFVMEFVDGVSLDERLEVGPLPVRQAASLAAQTAHALQFAHDHGIIHRDVKPSNLMLREDGRIAITDFGLAREAGSGSMTESGALIGTPMYMAPEQVRGERDAVDTRVDVYGLGATLYHLVTGRAPFVGPTAEVLQAVLEKPPAPPRRARRDLPAPLEAIILKALEKEPARRYGSALEMAEDLDRFAADERVRARRPGPAQRLWRVAAARPVPTGLLILVVALSLGAWQLHRGQQQRYLESALHQTEGRLAQAASLGDGTGQPRSAEDRRALLHEAVLLASDVIEYEPGSVAAHLLRARAYQRLHDHRSAVVDLDRAAELSGEADAHILEERIVSLRELPDTQSRRRLRADLIALMDRDTGARTRYLVAEHLLELAGESGLFRRAELLPIVGRILSALSEQDPRSLSLRARLVELQGDPRFAAELMRHARERFPGSPLVHRRAAELFARVGLDDESAAARHMAAMLDPAPGAQRPQAPATAAPPRQIDVDEVEGFLERIDGLLRAARKL